LKADARDFSHEKMRPSVPRRGGKQSLLTGGSVIAKEDLWCAGAYCREQLP